MKKTQALVPSQHPREVDDAIAFLHSMIGLLEARGCDHVDDQFACTMIGMSGRILEPNEPRTGTRNRTKAIADAFSVLSAVGSLLEELPCSSDRLPISILKGLVAMIETTIRAERGGPVETAADRAA